MNITNKMILKNARCISWMLTYTIRCSNIFLFKKNKDYFPLKIAHSFHNSVRVLLSNFSRTKNRRQLCTLKQMTSTLNIIPYSLSRRPCNTEMGRRFIPQQHLVAKSGFTGPQIFHLHGSKALFKLRDKYCFTQPEGVCC